MPESTPTKVRDSDFFLDPIFIRVEDAIFKIPIHYIAKIGIFSTTFSLPPGEDGIEGLTEENPLVLHQISKVDFKDFLRILIPLQIPPNYSKVSAKVWTSTLKLATMWDVKPLRDLAIQNLNLEVVDMILLGFTYRVSQWFINGCTKLIMRKHGPTEKEANYLNKHLGIGFVLQIYGLRERMLYHRITKGSGAGLDCQRLVRETFPDKIFEDNSKTN